MTKTWGATAVAILAVAVLFGCFYRLLIGDTELPHRLGADGFPVHERTIKVMFSETDNQKIRANTPIQQEIAKRTGFRLMYTAVPTSNYNDKKKTLLATQNAPDIMQIDKQDVNEFSSAGAFLPLMDYMNRGLMPNLKKLWDENPDLIRLTVDGELYGFPAIVRDEAKNGFGPVIRMDLLQKHHLPVPRSFDELLDVLKRLKELYPESAPWSVRKGTSQLLAASSYMLGSGYNVGNGIYFDKDKDGGRYVYGPASPQFKNVLTFLNKAYTSGVLDPDYAVLTQQQWTEKLTGGESFFFLDNSGFGLNFTRALRTAHPEAFFQVMPIPEYAEGKARAQFYMNTFSGKMFAVSSKVQDPESVVKLLDWMYSEEAFRLMNFGIEGVHYTLDGNGRPVYKKDFVETFIHAQPTPYYALYSELGCCQLSFTPYYSNTLSQFQIEKMTGTWDKLNEEYWSLIASDPAYRPSVMEPPLTKREAARAKDIHSTLNDMLDEQFDKFIMGLKPIEGYDQVIRQARELGASELEDIYNRAAARLNSDKESVR
ncbi:Lipoprotein LipO precursor [Paenibacillus konkukensis]|uniref:Lipoprotein LipO n=1 Tax=Paenibacillus konkukensis TaxID=2020716 RepID=A0ABY4RQ47_9BACL|nr:extracellular solute-binding protein [Paenibacillus konkukensis]UQZ83683.1 Lipoprotein LipO precursor [Paenibacillus konkukensis]